MGSLLPGNHCFLRPGVRESVFKGRFHQFMSLGCLSSYYLSKQLTFFQHQYPTSGYCQNSGRNRTLNSSIEYTGVDPDDSEDENEQEVAPENASNGMNGELLKENLERIFGTNDSAFSGIDLATLIRKKYGRSYDVMLIKKEFMGRNLLAMNVMWKYVEQRSFPLTEEEYLLRLDDVANALKYWGAVSHIRSSLSKLKERPRIGKAVSIFIDMDESGGRSNEWIYK